MISGYTQVQPIARSNIVRYTPNEYLLLEEHATYKSEYRHGVIVPMAGASLNHNQIVVNVCTLLRTLLNKQKYRVFMSDIRLWIPRKQCYTYPDLLVLANPPQFHEQRKDTIVNPLMIIEVLSEGTRDYDRGDKFVNYRTIATFQEYVLVDQESMHVEQFTKTSDGKWILSEYEESEIALHLASVRVDIALKEIYEQVEWTSPKDSKEAEGKEL